jgi:hypothetical protein
MPAATYSGSSGYFDTSAANAREDAANAMLTAAHNNDLAAYRQAAVNFLAASPAGSGLPVWATTITVDSKGNLVNNNYQSVASDGSVIDDNHTYAGMRNPVPGTPNIADGTADYHGMVIPRTT